MPTLNWLGKKEGLDVTERKLEVCLKGNTIPIEQWDAKNWLMPIPSQKVIR